MGTKFVEDGSGARVEVDDITGYPVAWQNQNLNAYQQKTKAELDKMLATKPQDLTSISGFFNPTNFSSKEEWMKADPTYAAYLEDVNNGPSSAAVDRLNSRKAELDAIYNSGNTQSGMEQENYNNQLKMAQTGFQYALDNPDGGGSTFMKIGSTVMPIVVGGMFGAGALGALNGAAGGAAATGAGASTAGTAAGLGGAATSAGGAAASASGALGSAWSSLPSFLQSGLTSAGIKAGTNVATGNSIFDGVLQAGLMGGLGSAASSVIGPQVGQGLQNLGLSPDTIKSLIKPVTTGLVSTGTGLIRGQDFGQALLGGIQNGTISYAGNSINDYLKGTDLNDPTKQVLAGAGKGAVGSAIKGQNPLQGALSGGVNGAFNYGTGLLGSGKTDSTPTKVKMGDDDDILGWDGKDWLKDLESDYTDPLGVKGNDSLYDLINGSTSYGMNDSFKDSYPDLYEEYLSGDGKTFNTGNSVLDSILKGVGSSVGSAVTGGSKNSLLDNLMKQLGNVGSAATSNPLGALAGLLGAYGSLKSSGSSPDLSAVDKLMEKGAAQQNTQTILPTGQITARDPRMFVQNYDASGNRINNNYGQINDTYQQLLGRQGDVAGSDFWNNQLNNGVTMDQFRDAVKNSDEYTKRQGALSQLGGQ